MLSDVTMLLIAAITASAVAASASAGAALSAVAAAAVSETVLTLSGVYERQRQPILNSGFDEFRRIGVILGVTGGIAFAIGGSFGIGPARTRELVLFVALSLMLVPVGRALARHQVLPRLRLRHNVLIVGAGIVGQAIARKLVTHASSTLSLVGFIDDYPQPRPPDLDWVPVVGGEHDLAKLVDRYAVSELVLAFSRTRPDELLETLRANGIEDVHLTIAPRYFEIIPSNADITEIGGMPLLSLPPARLPRRSAVTKRLVDITVAVVAAVVLVPLIAMIALAIKLDSDGPVFFRQERVGRRDDIFWITKFRTMYTGTDMMRELMRSANRASASGPLFKVKDDPRVTRVGRILRATSLDELPQVWNVLRGEMSLVGPRPFVPEEDCEIAGWARRRLQLRPGITGPWQVLGRHTLVFEEMLRLDYVYVRSWTLWRDIKLLCLTLPIVVGRRGD